MLKARLHNTIYEIDAALWNSIIGSEDLYHRHEFVGIIEDAQIENSKFWYLLIYNNDELVATVCLSAMEMSLDLLIEGELKWIKAIRKIWKKFLKVNILMCGLPISLGQKNIKIKEGNDISGILKLITRQMHSIAKREGIYHLIYKEFNEEDTASLNGLITHKFFKAFSLPYMDMDIKWESFGSYLSNLRHSYRRKIKKGLCKLNISKSEIPFNTLKSGFALNDLKANSESEFYEHYLAVMKRASSKLETLNSTFFELFFDRYKGKFDLIQVKDGEKILSSAILIRAGDTLHFMLIGLPQYRNDKFDPYFNLLYAIVQFAINNKISKIRLGQTAYWVKQQIGGTASNVFLFYHCRKKPVHFLLKNLKHLIFPETKLKSINVFNKVTAAKPKISHYEFAE